VGGGQSSSLKNIVFIGDSLTAGYQNGSLLDTQQPNGYAALVASQAGASVVLPLIAAPGAPAVLHLVSVGPPPVVAQTSGTTTGRDNTALQPTDLAVPGHLLHDVLYTMPTASPTTNQQLITNLVLAYPLGNTKSQLGQAIDLKPSMVVVWAGNNDALAADEAGTPSAMTSLSSFTTDFTQLLTTLKSQATSNIVVANIPDVTLVPYMTPADIIMSEGAALTGLPAATVGAALGIRSGDLVNAEGLASALAMAQSGSVKPLPDSAVLTAAEAATVRSTVDSYNQVIQQQATAVGATVVDIHALFNKLAAGVTINNYAATNSFLGGLFGLDGIHPTNTGYALVANEFITAINTRFGTSVAAVNTATVAASDPYFGSSIKPTAMHIPVAAAQQSDLLMTGWKKQIPNQF
jgi:lysophospholipase L1-like esterase